MAVFALADCNNFYASCERAFNPALENRPVVVLSNNDGCIIARSAEAKAAGIGMGAPYFKVRRQLEQVGASVFSSNYALYGDMSARVMAILGRFAPGIEVYSIDEAFLDLAGVPGGATHHARRLRATVLRWTGIPISVGMGATKTLAKIANRFAKKHPQSRGVFDLTTCPDPDAVLAATEIGDVWGIGPRHARRLRDKGVLTALDFRNLDRDWVQKKMTVTGLHTLLELRGMPCLDFESLPKPKKTIVSSRSFGSPVQSLEQLQEALACYTTRASEKLRRQKSTANGVLVYVQTNRFMAGAPQYSNSVHVPLDRGSNYTPMLIKAAAKGLDSIYRTGFDYKKCGVMLTGIEPENGRWMSFFELPPDDRPQDAPLMRTLDEINSRWGRDTVSYAASGIERSWRMRREMRSPRYTTVWSELPVAR